MRRTSGQIISAVARGEITSCQGAAELDELDAQEFHARMIVLGKRALQAFFVGAFVTVCGMLMVASVMIGVGDL